MQMMQKIVLLSLLVAALIVGHYLPARLELFRPPEAPVLSVTMNLSAFGVESDTYPTIVATLDFKRHTSHCERSYYDPAYPNSTYQLSAEEINRAQQLLQQADLNKLKASYSVGGSDLPTSTTIIHTANRTLTMKDYGLAGDAPLSELYRIVYKFEY